MAIVTDSSFFVDYSFARTTERCDLRHQINDDLVYSWNIPHGKIFQSM